MNINENDNKHRLTNNRTDFIKKVDKPNKRLEANRLRKKVPFLRFHFHVLRISVRLNKKI